MPCRLLNLVTDVQIASIVKCGHPTIEKLHVRCIMSRAFIPIDLFQQSVLVTSQENIS